MKKMLFSFSASVLLLSACQSSPLPTASLTPMLRASTPQQLRAASTPRSSFYGLEDFRNFLAAQLFNALDQNKDQAVHPQEFSRLLNKAVLARFNALDSNHDGSLNLAELQAGKDSVFSERYSEKTLREKLTLFFQSQDLNHDNFVSDTESKGNLNLIFDYDHDNRFSLNEFIDATSSLLRLAPSKTEEFLKVHLG